MQPEQGHRLFAAALGAARAQADRGSADEGVGAAALTGDGSVLTGVWIKAMVDSACLCAETGPISEAHRTGQSLVASICVYWTAAAGPTVLPACGVCQERLAVFGRDVLIGVGHAGDPSYRFDTLAALRPSPWWSAFED